MKKIFSSLTKAFSRPQSTKDPNEIQWRFVARYIDDATYSMHIMAFIKSPWYLFTKQLNTPDGSLLCIEYEQNAFVIFVNDMEEMGTPIEHYDLALEEEVRCYKVAVNLIQRVKVIIDDPVQMKGTIHYVIGDGINRIKTCKKEFRLTLE